jgi:hypothetical protein
MLSAALVAWELGDDGLHGIAAKLGIKEVVCNRQDVARTH